MVHNLTKHDLSVSRSCCAPQGCEPKVENGSVGFSVSRQKVGRFFGFSPKSRSVSVGFFKVYRMVMENRPVDPGSIQGSHRPISFIRIKHRTRANDILCKTEY